MVGDENLVHQEGHQRADGHHNHAGQADGVDAAHNAPVGPEAPEAQVDVVVFGEIEVNRQHHAAALADDGGDGGAPNAHAQGEDENGVENDVDDGAQALGVHGVHRPPGALQEPLEHHLAKQEEAEAADDLQIFVAHLGDVLHAGLVGEQGGAEAQAQHRRHHRPHKGQEHAVHRHVVGPALLHGPQGPAHHDVDAHGGAGGQADH